MGAYQNGWNHRKSGVSRGVVGGAIRAADQRRIRELEDQNKQLREELQTMREAAKAQV